MLGAFSQQQANVNFLGMFNIRLGKVMFGSLGLLNAFSIQDIFLFTVGILVCNPIINQGRFVMRHSGKWKRGSG